MTHSCQCRLPGFCEHHQRIKVGRQWDICNHQVLTPARCRAYWELWEQEAGRAHDVATASKAADQADRDAILVPARTDNLSCLHRGALLRNEPRSSTDAKSNSLEHIHACARHGECSLRHSTVGGANVCTTCEDREAFVVLNSDYHGFGDACVAAWLAEGARQGPLKLLHYATGEKRAFLEMLGQDVLSSPRDSVGAWVMYAAEPEGHSHPTPAIQRGRHIKLETGLVRPPLVLSEDYREFGAVMMKHDRKTVLLFPHTAHRVREWPPVYWLELHSLLTERGYAPRLVCDYLDTRYCHTEGFLTGISWQHVAGLMLAADLIVGNDSGPVHLGGTLNRPAVAIFGPTGPSMLSQYPSVRPIQASREELACTRCYFHPPFSRFCGFGCLALSHVTPPQVLETICEVVAA